jgi:hypothetical protein
VRDLWPFDSRNAQPPPPINLSSPRSPCHFFSIIQPTTLLSIQPPHLLYTTSHLQWLAPSKLPVSHHSSIINNNNIIHHRPCLHRRVVTARARFRRVRLCHLPQPSISLHHDKHQSLTFIHRQVHWWQSPPQAARLQGCSQVGTFYRRCQEASPLQARYRRSP